MSGFTPGPWVVERADDAYCIANVGNLVIIPGGGKVKHDNAEADARLIAAAPDLLEALEATNAQMRIAYECVEAGRYDEALLHLGSMPRQRTEAIAKARGTPC